MKRPLFDLDREIELAQGRSIAALFREEGEVAFRQIEAETLDGVIVRPGIVLAPGGGVVERPDNRALLREHAFALFLDVDEGALIARLRGSSNRPPLTALDAEEEIRTVARRRRPLYQECAELTLSIPPNESVAQTWERLWRALANVSALEP